MHFSKCTVVVACLQIKKIISVQYEFLFGEPLTSFGDKFEAKLACLWPYLFRHWHSSFLSKKASKSFDQTIKAGYMYNETPQVEQLFFETQG